MIRLARIFATSGAISLGVTFPFFKGEQQFHEQTEQPVDSHNESLMEAG
jgi:hypothetical protein